MASNARTRRIGVDLSELTIGTTLLGHLIDFDESSPETQVTLERTSNSILLTLTWSNRESPYAYWFWPDDAELGRTAGPPPRLLFHHAHGAVLLVGCAVATARGGLWGPGVGVVNANYAILDVVEDLDFQLVNGLRTVIPGLRSWLGVRSVTGSRGGCGGTEVDTVVYTARNAPAIDIPGLNNLRFVPTWRAVPDAEQDAITLYDEAMCESSSRDLHDWSFFLDEHRAVRDLLIVSAWTSDELRVRSACRIEAEAKDGGELAQHEVWYRVEAASSEGSRDLGASPHHLIRFEDLGHTGIRLWIELRADFARAIDPLVSSKLFKNPTIEVNLFLVAMGLEAVGYRLALESGLPEKKAGDLRFSERLRLVAADIRDVLPFDADDWITGTTEVYNSIKHANRESMDIALCVQRWNQSVIAFRVWIAHRLGVPHQEIISRLRI